MLIISNTSKYDPDEDHQHLNSNLNMLGMSIVDLIIKECPNMSLIGNLKTWSYITYYDPHHEHNCDYINSQLAKLKKVEKTESGFGPGESGRSVKTMICIFWGEAT